MSTGGIFTQITNDGKQDKMIFATELLNKRLIAIREQRAGLPDPNPTLVDIEKTHLLFMNAHFKPHATTTYEYQRVQNTTGQVAWGGRVQYNIPQFGEFFADIACHIQVAGVTATSVQNGTTQFAANGNIAVPSSAPQVRYCDYPGERFFQRVQMEINGNPLDEYFPEQVNMYRQFSVQPNKLVAWKRCMGQEVAQNAYLNQAKTVVDSTRVGVSVSDGFQTPKAAHTTLEMFIPLLFWFNRDPRLAVASVAIPQGQRFLNFEIARSEQMLVAINRGNAYIDSTKPGGLTNDATFVDPLITRSDLYINNLFVMPEVHDIYIARIGFSLIRVHRQHKATLTTDTNSLQLTSLKWPIENLTIGFRPTENINLTTSAAKLKTAQDWHKFCQVVETPVTVGGLSAKNVRRQQLIEAVINYVITVNGVTPNGTTAALGALAAGVGQAQINATDALKVIVYGANDGNAATVNFPANTFPQLDGQFALAGAPGRGTPLVAGPPLIPDTTLLPLHAGAVGTYPTTAEINNIGTLVDHYLSATNTIDADAVALLREEKPLVQTIKLSAHSVVLYNDIPAQFFNSYTPLVFGGALLNAPTDPGVYFVPFCLYPGAYQPSGHINVSRAREFFLDYNCGTNASRVVYGNGASTTISSTYTADLIVNADCINFLLISDGSALLRYST